MIWLIVVILVVVVIGIILSFQQRETAFNDAVRKQFSSDTHNDKVLIVEGWSDEEIKKIISDFIKTYEKDGYPEYIIESKKYGIDTYRLTFPKDIHPLLFTFLVNYVAYPFGMEYENRTIVIVGKTTLTIGFEGIDSTQFGQRAILYIPANDVDHDIVYLQTRSGTNFANSFTTCIWKSVSDARLSNQIKKLTDSF